MRFLSIAERGHGFGGYVEFSPVFQLKRDRIGCHLETVPPVFGIDLGRDRSTVISNLKCVASGIRKNRAAKNQSHSPFKKIQHGFLLVGGDLSEKDSKGKVSGKP